MFVVLVLGGEFRAPVAEAFGPPALPSELPKRYILIPFSGRVHNPFFALTENFSERGPWSSPE